MQLRALELLVAKLRKERRGASDAVKPKAAVGSPAPTRIPAPAGDALAADSTAPARVSQPASGKSRGRYVSRSDRRTVWARDGARCAYVDERGVRCRETTGLEIHHRHVHALGGPNTACNLELRCRAHNTLAAEADFGREHMDRVRPCDLRIEA